MRYRWTACLLLAAACTPNDPADMLRASARAMGTDAIRAAAPFLIRAAGSLNKTPEGQGYAPGEPASGSFVEALALDPAGDAVQWEYREDRYDGTHESFGETYVGDTLQYLIVRDLGFAVPTRAASWTPERMRIRRRFPHVLVEELLQNPDGLRPAADSAGDRRLTGTLPDGTDVTVSFGPDWLVRSVSYDAILPGRGPTRTTWWYDDYQPIAPNGLVPLRWSSRVGDSDYTDVAVYELFQHTFAAPADLRLLDVRPREEPAEAALVPDSVAAGVYRVPGVRSGFAPLVVEFDTFLVAIDAPASFPILGHLPASETDAAGSFSHASERFVDLLRATWPEKPVRYVLLTHHHADHAGGVRAFVAAGATVVGSAESIAVARELAALQGVQDRLAAEGGELRVEVIDSVWHLESRRQALDLVPVRENPHAAGMLVVSLPRANGLFVSDLLTPDPVADYPRPSHAALDTFFLQWLAASGLQPDSIWTMHGNGPITPAHLARIDTIPEG